MLPTLSTFLLTTLVFMQENTSLMYQVAYISQEAIYGGSYYFGNLCKLLNHLSYEKVAK
jgi:hypothetical protein